MVDFNYQISIGGFNLIMHQYGQHIRIIYVHLYVLNFQDTTTWGSASKGMWYLDIIEHSKRSGHIWYNIDAST